MKLPKKGTIQEQEFEITGDAVFIYGYNNCGKTTLLKLLDEMYDKAALRDSFEGKESVMSLYIPTNRIVVSDKFTNQRTITDTEEIINYKRDNLYDDFSMHIKKIRDDYLGLDMVKDYITDAIKEMFGIDISNFQIRHSDGIENIINLYVNIIWILTYQADLSKMRRQEFYKLIRSKTANILIDEIEMYLHVSVQSKLIQTIKQDFSNCVFILSTHSPLLLTRYENSSIYKIKDGMLHPIKANLFYKDLDVIYEGYFHVKELPPEIAEDINYLGNIALGKNKSPNAVHIAEIENKIKSKYSNLYEKYRMWIVKAKDKAGFYE